jgi:hypothetical protein
MYVALANLPDVVRATLSSFGYHRPDIDVRASETYSPRVGGGKGRRGFCACIDVGAGIVESKVGSWGGSNMFNQGNQIDMDPSTYPIPENCVVVSGTTGGGHGTFARMLVHPSMLPALLPGPDADLTENDKVFLYIMRTLKSAYRKESAARSGVTWPDAERLDFLQSKGLVKVNKAGSIRITTDGKNAADKCGRSIY